MNNKYVATLLTTAASAVAIFALATPAQAQVGVYIGTPPPPLRYEPRPAIPGPGYVWTDGYYEPYGGAYRWHAGFWQRPPYAGAYWVHPHYDHYDRGWGYHEGFWAHEDHGGYRGDGFRRKSALPKESPTDQPAVGLLSSSTDPAHC